MIRETYVNLTEAVKTKVLFFSEYYNCSVFLKLFKFADSVYREIKIFHRYIVNVNVTTNIFNCT